MCCKKTAAKALTPVAFTPNVVGPSYRVWWCPAQETTCLWPLFGAVYIEPASSVIMEVQWVWEQATRRSSCRLTLLSEALEMFVSNSAVNSIKWIVQVLQITMSGYWSVVAMPWGKLYQPGRSAVICIPGGRWSLQKSKMTARTSSCLEV